MAETIFMHDLQEDYPKLVREIRDRGAHVAPRGFPTRELRDVTLVFSDPDTPRLPLGIGRGINPLIGMAEAAQLLAGVSDAQQLISIAGSFSRFTNDGALMGAYGPRLYDQIPLVVRTLAADPDTRQAHMTLWRPGQLETTPHDVPCTVSFDFAVRSGVLHMSTLMRSNDVWLGTSYDIFFMRELHRMIALCLQLPVGEHAHTVRSLHLYERDLEAVDKLQDTVMPVAQEEQPPTLFSETATSNSYSPFVILSNLRSVALAVVRGYWVDASTDDEDSFNTDYWEVALRPHVTAGAVLCRCRYLLVQGSEHPNNGCVLTGRKVPRQHLVGMEAALAQYMRAQTSVTDAENELKKYGTTYDC